MDNQINERQSFSKKQQRRLARLAQKQAQAGSRSTKRATGRIIFWVVILGIIGLFVYLIAQLVTSSSSITGTQTDMTISATDHSMGKAGAKVQLVEYADFQCPGCGAFYPVVKELVNEYQDRILFAYRYFPLPQHPHARITAEAAEAAGVQGKFWEMHDLLFDNQTKWSPLQSVDAVIANYASQLHLDVTKFNADLAAKQTKDRVEADYQGGAVYGVNSTPSFFLNGIKIALPRSLDDFKAVIDAALLESTTPSSTPVSATAQ